MENRIIYPNNTGPITLKIWEHTKYYVYITIVNMIFWHGVIIDIFCAVSHFESWTPLCASLALIKGSIMNKNVKSATCQKRNTKYWPLRKWWHFLCRYMMCSAHFKSIITHWTHFLSIKPLCTCLLCTCRDKSILLST